jgi:hypothetical protein
LKKHCSKRTGRLSGGHPVRAANQKKNPAESWLRHWGAPVDAVRSACAAWTLHDLQDLYTVTLVT